MLTMTKEKLNEIAGRYSYLLVEPEDMELACRFAWEVICAEYDAVKEQYPYARNTLERLETAEHIVYDIYSDIETYSFEENEKLKGEFKYAVPEK